MAPVPHKVTQRAARGDRPPLYAAVEACLRTGRIEDVFKELADRNPRTSCTADSHPRDQYQVRSLKAIEHTWHLALLAHTYLQALRLEVIKLPKCKRPITLGDALALHRSLNDQQALRWIRRNPDLFRLIRLTDQLVA